MKVNISPTGQTLESYENFSIYPKALMAAQLENKIADEQATELICEGLLEAYEYKDYEQNVAFLSKKARQGCKIVLSCINGRRLADHFFYTEITNQEGNHLVFGEKLANKSIVFNEFDFIELLNKNNIQVVQIRREGLRDIFVCKKL